ncbi:amidase [Diaporthe helianthi]|uniref:Amidase n=1 Tax=Diaporthe helianthi TaxID=158607 RepID=A0A2P5I9T1_DIAHE|nr:amidase [Diaporthe helianthi]
MKWWGKTAKISIDIRDESIPKEWLLEPEHLPSKEQHSVLDVPEGSGSLTAEEIEMTNADVDSLLEAYQTHKWTVRQVTTAFLKKAVVINQLTNFVTEFLPEEALSQADSLDAHLASTNTLKGSLHGIPTSLAEPIPLGNHITHSGIVSRITTCDPAPTEDAPLIHNLKRAGAVIHLRTNVNQGLIGTGCENNVMGRTLNPHDRRLSPGGPCGGEGVSVGAGCTVLGVGLDVGIPAAFGGCYGFKPTAGRVPSEWAIGAEDGEGGGARCVVGPLARSADGLQAWMKAVLDEKADMSPASAPWRSVPELGSFTVGVMWDDGIVKPHPPVRRALRTAVDKIRAAGVQVVEWVPHDRARGYAMLAPLCFPDGGKRYLDEFDKSGERPVTSVVQALDDQTKESCGVSVAGLEDPQTLAQERESYQREHDALMAERGVDFILGPAYVGAGALHDDAKYPLYTSIWNILDLPSVVVPSGLRSDKVVDVKDETYVPKSNIDKETWGAYDPESVDRFPIALQLAGKRAEDEQVLSAAGVLDKIFKEGSQP